MQYVTTPGARVPALGFGTARMTGEECRLVVEDALELGYRHIDTAQMYNNEAAVGDAIENATVDRDDIFLVTKVLRRNLAYEDVLQSTEESLERLGTDIDLLLIHAPSRTVPVEESIRAMNQLQDEGEVTDIGVSKFSVDQMREAIDASETPIVTNQIEYHPFKDQSHVLEFCIKHGIMLTAFSPLAKGRVMGNRILNEIGDLYGKTEAQVALRWLIQQETVSAIPKAANHHHREENLNIFDFELTDEELNRVFELQGGVITRLRNLLGI